MTVAASFFGTETRIRMLAATLLALTVLRAGWIAVNIYDPDPSSVAWAVVPWPWPMGSWAVWAAELALVFYQARAALRLGRMVALRYAPRASAFLGLSARNPEDQDHLTLRNRSWLPTALQLSGILILTCCVVYWIMLMLWFWEWCPFDPYMEGFYGQRALVTGIVLSLLGLTFGGRYIARASGDVSTSFRVVTVGDDHWLAQRVHRLSDQLNLPRPAVGITDVFNAFAMGQDQKSSMVVIGTPLFGYEQDELDAVIGHELGHILHHDIARMTFAEGFQRMLAILVNIGTAFSAIMVAYGAANRTDARRKVRLVNGLGLLGRKTVFVGSELVTQAISRNREYHADAVGAHLTSPAAMARALKRVHGVADIPTPEERHYGYLMFRGAGFGHLFATHPPLEARLAALRARQASLKPVRHVASRIAAEGPTGARQRLGLAPVISQAETSSVARAKKAVPAARPASRFARMHAAVRKNANPKRLLIVGAVCAVVAVATPAVVSFYGLDRRVEDTVAAIAQTSSASWARLTGAEERARAEAEYAQRLRQVEARENALKAEEARFVSSQQIVRTGLLADRDKARAEVDDLKRQNASLSERLSAVTAERDELARQNETLRQVHEDQGDAGDFDAFLRKLADQGTKPEGTARSNLPGITTGAQ